MKYLWYTTSRRCGHEGLTHSTLPPGDVDAEMNTYEIHRILFFFCNGAFICNVAAEFIVSYTYEYQKKVVGLDTHCLCNQSLHKKCVIKWWWRQLWYFYYLMARMVLDVVWGVVHGIRGACVLCNVQQYGWTLYLKTTPSIHRIVIVRGAISSKTKVMFRTRMCEQSLLIVSSCYIRVQAMMIAIEEFLFPGESWNAYYLGRTSACNGKLLWCYMWHMCLLGNGNLQQQRYLGLMTSGVSRDAFR